MMAGVGQYSLMKLAFNSFKTPFVVGPSFLSESGKEFKRANRRSWFEEPLVLKDGSYAILSEEPWMGHTTCHGRPPRYVFLSWFFSSHHAHIPESYILESFPCDPDHPVFPFPCLSLFSPGIYVQRVCVFGERGV